MARLTLRLAVLGSFLASATVASARMPLLYRSCSRLNIRTTMGSGKWAHEM
jgi:hypothetical protein